MAHLSDEEVRAAASFQVLPTLNQQHLADCPLCSQRVAAWAKVAKAAIDVDRAVVGAVTAPSFQQIFATTPLLKEKTTPLKRRKTFSQEFSLVGTLLSWQIRLLPRVLIAFTVLGIAVGVTAAATAPNPLWSSSLFGVTVSLLVTLLAVWGCEPSGRGRAELAHTLPVAPAVVFAVQLLVVLGIQLVVALAGSVVLWAMGSSLNLTTLIASWLGPALLSTSIAITVGMWRAPWLGLLSGVAVWGLGWSSFQGVLRSPDAEVSQLLRYVWPTTPITVVVALFFCVLAVTLVARNNQNARQF